MPDYMSKRSKEEKDKSAQAVAKTINTTTPTHGRPGSWGKGLGANIEILTAPRKKGMSEQPPEAESPEEIEAVEEAIEEAVEAEIEAAVPEEKEPEELTLEAESEGITSTVGDLDELAAALTEEPLEAELELSVEEMKAEVEEIIEESNIPEEVKKDIVVEIVKETPVEAEPKEFEGIIDVTALKDGISKIPDDEPEIVNVVQPVIIDKNAEIARLEAELAELRPEKK